MNITREQARSIVGDVAELAEIASFRDIDTAVIVLRYVCTALGVDPLSVEKLVELESF